MLIKAKATITDGVALTLAEGDDLFVGKEVMLVSTGNYGIYSVSNGQTVTIAGAVNTVNTDDAGIRMEAAIPGGRARLVIEKTALVEGGADGVVILNQTSTIVNHGMVFGETGGFFIGRAEGNYRFTNTGTILVELADGIYLSDVTGTMTFMNSGRIISISRNSYAGGDGQDFVRNSGFMHGSVFLGDGDDVYDGRSGRVVGTIYGGDGTDRFVLGASVEKIDGGDGTDTDTLDFRLTSGVRVALDGAFAGTGAAKGDTYTGIEVLQGSLRGADVLRGDDQNNILRGNGGNDRLNGAAGIDELFGGAGRDALNGGEGIDVLIGGAGRDTLTGGDGSDAFIFLKPGDGADVITDFTRVGVIGNIGSAVFASDSFRIDASNFGIGGDVRGDFLAKRMFHSGQTNQAQDRSDRIIFRTGDETLWFDADGKGGKGPVLIADFSDGVRLLADDFVLV